MSAGRVIAVLGMHRSGTSVSARALKVLGVDLGDDLLPPVMGDNEKGYWEDRDINALNIAMMDHLNMCWDSLKILDAEDLKSLREAGFHRRAHDLILEKTKKFNTYAFKDPRTIRLIDFWDDVYQTTELNVSYVIAVRNPRSVVDSLEQSRGVPREIGYSLWLLHTLECLVKANKRTAVWVDYDAILSQPSENLRKISERLGLSIHPQELLNFEEGFLERSLRHTVHDFDNLINDPDSHQLIQEVYGVCLDLCRDVNPQINVEVNDRLTIEYQRLSAYFPALDRQWSHLKTCQKQSLDHVQLLEEKDRTLEDRASQLSGYETFVARQSDELRQSFITAKTLSDVATNQSEQLSSLSEEHQVALRMIRDLESELTCLGERFRGVEEKLNDMRLGGQKIKASCFDSNYYLKINDDITSQGQFEGRLAVPPNDDGGLHSVAGLIERLRSWMKRR